MNMVCDSCAKKWWTYLIHAQNFFGGTNMVRYIYKQDRKKIVQLMGDVNTALPIFGMINLLLRATNDLTFNSIFPSY